MKLSLVSLCVLCIIGEGICGPFNKEKKREGFSLISLPFKYHKIVSDFIDYAPKELLQVTTSGLLELDIWLLCPNVRRTFCVLVNFADSFFNMYYILQRLG